MTENPDIFDAAFLRRLEALDAALLRLRGSAGEGMRGGGRSSGQNEFRGHRPYSPGDDLRRLDWNAYGRLGKFFMREYERERAEHLTVLLDCSRSMRAGDPPKHVFARRIAAAYGYLVLKRGGTVTLAGQSPVEGLSRFSRYLDQLRKATPDSDTGAASGAGALAARARAPQDLVVVGDCLEPLDLLQPLRSMSERRTVVTVVQVLAPDELDPPEGGTLELYGLEEREALRITLDASTVVAYRQELERHLEALEAIALRHGWTLAVTDSAADLHSVFIGKLLAAGARP